MYLVKKPTRSKFKSYEIGYIHIDMTDFWLNKKKWNLFASIDSETKFIYAEIFVNKTMENTTLFLKNVYKFYSYKIHTILTDNGLQFTYRASPKDKQVSKTHPFDEIFNNNIERRLTKFTHP